MSSEMQKRIENPIELDESSIWMLLDRKNFNYSDGCASERYHEHALLQTRNLRSTSYELEQWIRDWSSEYHLSRKRAQLLRGFDFTRSKKVLEVGCGCGAITRFLGETFEDVVGIEGSPVRARLARLRTKGMQNVSIVCAPFEEVKFRDHFDIVFCIGVFEYSKMFVDASEPFDLVLRYFHDVLAPDGEVIIAIENQFGLKYFAWAAEDHNSIMFDGLEGYPHYPDKHRTFGYDELKILLKRHFKQVDFYFPYPDYKTPSCILSEKFFDKVKAGELIGRIRPSRYIDARKPLFDDRLVLLELEKNNKLPFFSNSFLIAAGKQNILSTKLKCMGLIYDNDRIEDFHTVTKFVEDDDGNIWADKTLVSGRDKVEIGPLTIRSCRSNWAEGLSVHTQVIKRVKEKSLSIDQVFAPCKIWLNTLIAKASCENGTLLLEGKYVDHLWHNTYVCNGECVFIDHEFEWSGKISVNVLLIRSIYIFLHDIFSMRDLNRDLRVWSIRSLIKRIAKNLGVALTRKDFIEFRRLQSKIGKIVFGKSIVGGWVYISLLFWNRLFSSFMLANINMLSNLLGKVHNIILSKKCACLRRSSGFTKDSGD